MSFLGDSVDPQMGVLVLRGCVAHFVCRFDHGVAWLHVLLLCVVCCVLFGVFCLDAQLFLFVGGSNS